MNEMHPAHRSGDADAAIELGRVPEHPSSSPPFTETEIEAERERRGHGISEENMNKKNQGNVDVEEGPVEPNDGSGGGRDDAAEQKREDDAPSQGQKLGKKKIFAVMMALCVCPVLSCPIRTIPFLNLTMSYPVGRVPRSPRPDHRRNRPANNGLALPHQPKRIFLDGLILPPSQRRLRPSLGQGERRVGTEADSAARQQRVPGWQSYLRVGS